MTLYVKHECYYNGVRGSSTKHALCTDYGLKPLFEFEIIGAFYNYAVCERNIFKMSSGTDLTVRRIDPP